MVSQNKKNRLPRSPVEKLFFFLRKIKAYVVLPQHGDRMYQAHMKQSGMLPIASPSIRSVIRPSSILTPPTFAPQATPTPHFKLFAVMAIYKEEGRCSINRHYITKWKISFDQFYFIYIIISVNFAYFASAARTV